MKNEDWPSAYQKLELPISSDSDQKSEIDTEDLTGGVYGFRYGNRPKI